MADPRTTGARSAAPEIYAAGRVVTCDRARASASDGLGVIDDGAVLVEGGRIADVDTREAVTRRHPHARLHHHPAGILTPGLVDAHTHLPWVGSRHAEYVLRMRGADYEEIAAAGGGIVSSMRAVRAASPDEIATATRGRLERMGALGVTTVEAKSGYGLDADSELRQLQALEAVRDLPGLPRVVPTFLALHALPPEAKGDRDGYAQRVAEETLPRVLELGVARYVDAYLDRAAFSVAQARPTLERARAAGLGVRLHVGQFADVGGAELAAELGAASVDHVEHLSASAADALAAAGVRAVLLPIASFTLAQSPPPIALLRRAGVPLVVASDANPGTAPSESLPLAMAFALRSYGLTPDEVLLGVTREAAASLGLEADTGFFARGARADLVVWDVPHEHALLLPWGTPRARLVLRDGDPLGAPPSLSS